MKQQKWIQITLIALTSFLLLAESIESVVFLIEIAKSVSAGRVLLYLFEDMIWLAIHAALLVAALGYFSKLKRMFSLAMILEGALLLVYLLVSLFEGDLLNRSTFFMIPMPYLIAMILDLCFFAYVLIYFEGIVKDRFSGPIVVCVYYLGLLLEYIVYGERFFRIVFYSFEALCTCAVLLLFIQRFFPKAVKLSPYALQYQAWLMQNPQELPQKLQNLWSTQQSGALTAEEADVIRKGLLAENQ